MAGLPDYASNPVQSENMGQTGDKSMEVALATKMQLILDQPMVTLTLGLLTEILKAISSRLAIQ